MNPAPWYEQLVERATQRRHSETLPQAKQTYQESAGMIYDDDRAYENRMGLFIEWFIFDRQPAEGTPNLLAAITAEARNMGDLEMAEAFDGFQGNVHGLFALLKLKKDRVIVCNLFDNKKYEVLQEPGELMFGKNDIFQGRLLPHQNAYFFSGNFCYHPSESVPFIRAEVKKLAAQETMLHKQLEALSKKVKDLHSRLTKADKALDKLAAKLAKGPNEKKTARLREEREDLILSRKNLEKEIAGLNLAREELEQVKIAQGIPRDRVRLMHRLGYMNLKWERSRNIALNDIYKN